MDVAFRNFGFLKLSMQRALLGNVPLNLAGVRAELCENIVVVSAYFFDEPSEKDIEHIEVAATEVIADFPEGYTLKTVFGLRGEIANEKSGWCFLRAEVLSAPRPSIVRS